MTDEDFLNRLKAAVRDGADAKIPALDLSANMVALAASIAVTKHVTTGEWLTMCVTVFNDEQKRFEEYRKENPPPDSN